MLKDLRRYFQSSHANLKKDKEAIKDPLVGGNSIIEQYDRLFTTMVEWSNNLIEVYEKDSCHDTGQS
jgi:hypothetical protein